eukprot:TRINITY_DN3959_c0_g1_i2.p1 TRINITY_DN3959_c0_g1~~TRINITY_DN3959_c0_g1_i2.p1  ORF type:complete len:660 (+),score=169.90 TRINITY_DN3959_c0_g1_i2:600-2579(+)
MEKTERLDFEGVKGVRRPRTFSSRKPRPGASQAPFLNEHDYSFSSPSPPSAEKACSEDFNKNSNHYLPGDDQRRKPFNGSVNGNGYPRVDSKLNYPKGGSDERVDEMRWRYDCGVSNKHSSKSPEEGRASEKKSERSVGKNHEYERGSKRPAKFKGHSDREDERMDREKGRFGEIFKRKRHGEEPDAPRRSYDGSDKHGFHDRSKDRERDRERNQEVHRSVGKSLDNGRNGDGEHSYRTPAVGLSGVSSKEGRNVDVKHAGYSKLGQYESRVTESKNGIEGRSSEGREHDKSADKELPSQESRPTKLKLKVGGVTHTLSANAVNNAAGNKAKFEGSSHSKKPPQPPEGGRRRQRLILPENSDDEDEFVPRMERSLLESPKKEVSTRIAASTELSLDKEDQDTKLVKEAVHVIQTEKFNNVMINQAVRKSSRTPKPRMFDGVQDDYVDDDGSVLQKRTLKRRTLSSENDGYEDNGSSTRRSSRVPKTNIISNDFDYEDEEEHNKRQRKKSRYEREAEDLYEEDEEAVSGYDDVDDLDMEIEGKKSRGKRKADVVNSNGDGKKEAHLTARQRAMQSFKEVNTELGANLIEFPDGLPHTAQRRKKEKLSDIDQQLKKAEAAQKRKMLVERNNNAIQAEAIKKILGHDSAKKETRAKIKKEER